MAQRNPGSGRGPACRGGGWHHDRPCVGRAARQLSGHDERVIELLRAETILGRLNGYRSVPFNIKIPRQTAGATANWVGEGLSKPVSKLVFDQVTLPWAKIAVICVITHELARFSNPSAEQLVR